MYTRQLIASLSIATAVTACSSSSPEPLPLATSFDITATLTFPDGTAPYGLPDSERLVLRLDDAPDGTVAAIWGADVGSNLGTFTRTKNGLSMQGVLGLHVDRQEPDSFDTYIGIRTLDLVLIDRDDDGEVDAVEGTGTGEFHQTLSDGEHEQPFTVELSGDLDTTPPVLAIDGDTAAYNVLDQLVIRTSEPLDPATTAVLSYGDTRVDLGQGPGAGPYARSFAADTTLLPFGTDLRIELDPAPRDLAGLASENVAITARTMDAPGLFSEDGFEGELVAVNRDAEVVTGVGTLPAITGTRSLLIESGDTLTMRIPLTGGETHLRFEARILADGVASPVCTGIGLRAGFPGLADGSIVGLYVLLPSDFDENTGDATWPVAGPITSVEHALPAGVAGEVIFDVFVPDLAAPCANAAMLIDDLRAE